MGWGAEDQERQDEIDAACAVYKAERDSLKQQLNECEASNADVEKALDDVGYSGSYADGVELLKKQLAEALAKLEKFEKMEPVGAEAGVSAVRRNLMNERGYAPYCGNVKCRGMMSRTKWDGEQFKCPCCGWRSQFPSDFIAGYKAKWHQAPNAKVNGGAAAEPQSGDKQNG